MTRYPEDAWERAMKIQERVAQRWSVTLRLFSGCGPFKPRSSKTTPRYKRNTAHSGIALTSGSLRCVRANLFPGRGARRQSYNLETRPTRFTAALPFPYTSTRRAWQGAKGR